MTRRARHERGRWVPATIALLLALKAAALAASPDIQAPRTTESPAATAGPIYSVDRYTIDGGGGTSAGGDFSLSGTIGQPDAEPLQPSIGGAFAVSGGYWPGAPVQALPIFADGFESLD